MLKFILIFFIFFQEFPGPGQYYPRMVNRPRSATHKIGSGLRTNLNGSWDTPGPGNYQSFSQLGGPKYVMAKKRENKLESETPGPGAYDPFLNFVNIKAPAHL